MKEAWIMHVKSFTADKMGDKVQWLRAFTIKMNVLHKLLKVSLVSVSKDFQISRREVFIWYGIFAWTELLQLHILCGISYIHLYDESFLWQRYVICVICKKLKTLYATVSLASWVVMGSEIIAIRQFSKVILFLLIENKNSNICTANWN